MSMTSDKLHHGFLLACHECDLMVDIPTLEAGERATCPRCGFLFTRVFANAKSKLFAFSATALIFMTLTLTFPFLIFTAQGNEKVVYFIQSLQSLGQDTYLSVVLFMLATTLVIPAIVLVGINYVLLSSSRVKPLPFTRAILRMVFQLQPWNMAEIFLLGILVSMVKIATLAHVEFGAAFLAFVLYIACMAATRLYLDRFQIWNWIGHHQLETTISTSNDG